MLVAIRNNILKAEVSLGNDASIHNSRVTYAQSRAGLCIDAVFRFEGFTGEEWPCLIDPLRKKLPLRARADSLS